MKLFNGLNKRGQKISKILLCARMLIRSKVSMHVDFQSEGASQSAAEKALKCQNVTLELSIDWSKIYE